MRTWIWLVPLYNEARNLATVGSLRSLVDSARHMFVRARHMFVRATCLCVRVRVRACAASSARHCSERADLSGLDM